MRITRSPRLFVDVQALFDPDQSFGLARTAGLRVSLDATLPLWHTAALSPALHECHLTGRYRTQVRAFMLSLDGATKQEVNQSPLAFVETPIQANVEQALARKDAIIRVRNAQVSVRAGLLPCGIEAALAVIPPPRMPLRPAGKQSQFVRFCKYVLHKLVRMMHVRNCMCPTCRDAQTCCRSVQRKTASSASGGNAVGRAAHAAAVAGRNGERRAAVIPGRGAELQHPAPCDRHQHGARCVDRASFGRNAATGSVFR